MILFGDETNSAYAEALEMPDYQFVMDYELDADTLAVITQSITAVDKDGTETLFSKMTVEVNVEEPSWVTEAMESLKEIEELPVTETRTVTVTVDPGTEKERVLSQTVKNGKEPYVVGDTRNDERVYLMVVER